MPSTATTRAVAASGAGAGAWAVRDAVATAVAGVSDPALVLVFPVADLPGTAAQTDAAPCPVAGMTASATLTRAGPQLGGCAAMAFDSSLATGIGVSADASRGLDAAARRATEAALAEIPADAPYRVVLLLVDPGSGDQAEVVGGAYRAAGPFIPLAGGGAGGRRPALYAHGRRVRDAVIAVAIGSDRPIGVGVADGCRTVGVPSIVTRAEGRLLLELDGRPAERVYREKLGAVGHSHTETEFEHFAVLHPLAQPELSGTRRLRHVLRRGPAGGLYCATTVPAHAAVDFTTHDPELVVRSAWDAVSDALVPLQGGIASAALVFDCAGRKRALGDDIDDEVDAIRSAFRGAPALAGAYTHGEIARCRGAKGDRNHALVVVAFA